MSILQDRFSKSFLEDIIRKHYEDDIKIMDTDVTYVVPPGDNYWTELLRIVVSFSTKKNRDSIQSMAMIVKSLCKDEFLRKFCEEMGFFNTELGIYSKILPMMDELKFFKKVAPKTYYLPTGLEKYIIVEDLSALNYKMPDRQAGLNLEHCLLAVQKLAYFHASSLVLHEKDSKVIHQFKNGVFCKSDMFSNLISIAYQETLKLCKREKELQKYYEKMTALPKNKIYNLSKRDLKFNVLNHGDFWCNNLMFHYDANEVVDDVLFVDFQGSIFTSPSFDLHYFIATSPRLDIKKQHIYNILQHYYKAFVKYVKILEVETSVPSWNDFEKDFSEKALIGTCLSVMYIILPFFKTNKMKTASVPNFIEHGEEGSFRHHCYTNSIYIDEVKFLLPFYDSLGVFNT
ncbi:hypothetical protein RN001_013736 [Aquatica leii]|uniref:CHK kinase-like domain-containing protein n=1 Tax=Aquatica leii TaxID=1421715 RepID=A0AAN7P2X5_9COLE|nr:hypothetical protein RN001_013736 [Aquatica leii]